MLSSTIAGHASIGIFDLPLVLVTDGLANA